MWSTCFDVPFMPECHSFLCFPFNWIKLQPHVNNNYFKLMQEDREFWVNACCMLGRGRGGSGNTNAVQAFFFFDWVWKLAACRIIILPLFFPYGRVRIAKNDNAKSLERSLPLVWGQQLGKTMSWLKKRCDDKAGCQNKLKANYLLHSIMK